MTKAYAVTEGATGKMIFTWRGLCPMKETKEEAEYLLLGTVPGEYEIEAVEIVPAGTTAAKQTENTALRWKMDELERLIAELEKENAALKPQVPQLRPDRELTRKIAAYAKEYRVTQKAVERELRNVATDALLVNMPVRVDAALMECADEQLDMWLERAVTQARLLGGDMKGARK